VTSHDLDTVLGWRGSTVIDREGEKIGTLKELYLDQDDRPAWAAVETGLFGLRQSFVPLEGATALDDQVQVPFAKDQVKDAPNIDPETHLSEDEESRLHDHYGVRGGDAAPRDREAADAGGAPGVDADDAPREGRGDADDAPRGEDDAMTRSEEELIVGTRRKVRGRARLRKYVVTEHVQRTIPVQREEVRVEYEPEEGAAEREGDTPADR
jgi:stress response protein YsnF